MWFVDGAKKGALLLQHDQGLRRDVWHQGRNFCLKSGSTDSEGERGALGSRGERGGEWGESIPSSSDSGSGRAVWAFPVESPAENGFTEI